MISGFEVYDWDESEAPLFQAVAKRVLDHVGKEPIQVNRINEVGNPLELLVLNAFSCWHYQLR